MKQTLVTENTRKTVLITGCSSGIGYHTAHYLDSTGYRVIASARHIADVDRLRGEGLRCLQLDLDSSDSIQKAVDQTLEISGGHLYGLFNNAGYGQPGAVEDLRRDVLRKQFETNVFGTIELTNRLIPSMRAHNEGRIIQNSSVLGFIALAYRGAYTASKYALEGLYDTLRLELADTNIHAVLIEPGPITSLFRKNAFIAYQQNIDRKKSAHRDKYLKTESRLAKEGSVAPFTLPAMAVAKKVRLALESKKPRPRYYVTAPTYIFGALKRVLSQKLMDKILLKASDNKHK